MTAVVDDAGGAAGTEPFDIAYVGHLNSGLDAVLKNLESYRTGRHGPYIEYREYIYGLSHFSEILSFPVLYPGADMVSEQLFGFNIREVISDFRKKEQKSS